MAHPDDEVLAQFALDDPLAVDAATLVHISECGQCTRIIDEVQRAVDAVLAAAGRPDLRSLAAAPSTVWLRVLDRVGGSTEPVHPAPADSTRPLSARGLAGLFGQRRETIAIEPTHHVAPTTHIRDRRRVWPAAVAGVVAGLLVGGGGVWLATRGDDSGSSGDVTTSRLGAIHGSDTSGVIALDRAHTSPRITITLDRLDPGKGFVEAWLFDEKTGGFVSLGVMDGTEGTFVVPAILNLSKFSTVDVSRERFDGDPGHSPRTLARGPVPEE